MAGQCYGWATRSWIAIWILSRPGLGRTRCWRPAYDLKVFFTVVAKDPIEVTTSDVLGFITAQRGDRRVVRLADGESGLSARTIQRRLSSISGLYGFLLACGEVEANPVPRGLSNRKRSRTDRGTPLVRTPRTLPKILEPVEVEEPGRDRDSVANYLDIERPKSATTDRFVCGVKKPTVRAGRRHPPRVG